jgi:hypothetical protein
MDYDGCHDGYIDEAAIALTKIESAWDKYIAYLKERYPPQNGEEWKLTCEHLRELEGLIK